MRRLLIVSALVAVFALPAAAAGGLTFLPQASGQRATYHLVRTTQTASGPLSVTSTFNIVRRAGTTLVIERTAADGTPNLSILKANPDGTLALADKPTAADADLTDLLYAINIAVAATRDGDPAAGGTWVANVPTAPAPGATTAPIVLTPSALTKTSFDFSGTGQASAAPPARQRAGAEGAEGAGGGGMRGGGAFPGGGGGFPGAGGGGGAFPGGGGGAFPRRSRNDQDASDAAAGSARGGSTVALAIHIEGHVSDGRASRVAITETRTITFGNAPYINVGSWTITTGS